MIESVGIDINISSGEKYNSICDQLGELLNPDDYILTNLTNFTAILKQAFEKISWIGFYLFDGNQLVLGPFQGIIACTKIKIGEGVCGTAFIEKKTIIVKDVGQFKGHIACDSNSKSEIVVPLIKNKKIFGVLDLDSHSYDAFNNIDAEYLEKICKKLLNIISLENFIIK